MGADLYVVTDFLHSPVDADNTWYHNNNMSDFFDPPNSPNLDFSNPDLLQKIVVSIIWFSIVESRLAQVKQGVTWQKSVHWLLLNIH